MPGSDDRVEVYLSSLQPLLGREEEAAVLRRMVRWRALIRRTISQCKVIHEAVAALAEQVLSGSRKVEDVVDVDPLDLAGQQEMSYRLAEVIRCHERERASEIRFRRTHDHSEINDTSRAIEHIPFTDTQCQEFIQRIERVESEQLVVQFIRNQEQQLKDAEKVLLLGNLRQVVAIAREHAQCGLPVMDLVQRGNFALFHALSSFDYDQGSKFSTYAAWCIRQAISRWIVTIGSKDGMLEGLLQFPRRSGG